jgi:hypothetical protein
MSIISQPPRQCLAAGRVIAPGFTVLSGANWRKLSTDGAVAAEKRALARQRLVDTMG